jgi:RNA polymerase sigma-70 factor (ECF subfamily)
MFTIMRHVWQNERRRLSRSPEILFDEAVAAAAGDSCELALGRRLLVSEVRAAVDSLQPIWREIIVMRDIEELSYAQIAAVVGCPIGTVMSRLSRARAALRDVLTPRVQEVRR